jgi:VanZ family protein
MLIITYAFYHRIASFYFYINMKSFLLLLVIACIGGVFYFSWLPSPNFGTETYLPSWILDWSSIYYNLRTAVPFVAIGFLLEVRAHQNKIIGKIKSRLRLFVRNTAISLAVVCIAEGGQFLLENRNPDLTDVLYGILGSGIGSLWYYLVARFINFKRIDHAK